MGKKIFMGNLPITMTQDDLEQMVASKGDVSNIRLVREPDGRSRGFAFVEMLRNHEADEVIESLNGAEIEGRKIVVNEARPQESPGRRRTFGKSGRRSSSPSRRGRSF